MNTCIILQARLGSVRLPNKVIEDINDGKYDLVAVGRALLADHEWALKMEEGRLDDIKPYNEDTLKTYF